MMNDQPVWNAVASLRALLELLPDSPGGRAGSIRVLNGYGSSGPPIRYEAVAECLAGVAVKACDLGASVHMPRIGCGLAGGDWAKIEPLIERQLVANGVDVTVYAFPSA